MAGRIGIIPPPELDFEPSDTARALMNTISNGGDLEQAAAAARLAERRRAERAIAGYQGGVDLPPEADQVATTGSGTAAGRLRRMMGQTVMIATPPSGEADEDFDPKAYLAAKAAPPEDDFDPKAYLAAKQTALQPAEKPSGYEAGLRGAAQGATLGFGDEANALVDAYARWAGLSGDQGGKEFGQLYESSRNEFRHDNDRAQQAHPLAYLGGNVAGGLITSPLVGAAGAGAAKAAGALHPLLGMAAADAGLLGTLAGGAGVGLANGIGTSEADAPGALAKDALAGAGGGLIGGAVGYGLSKIPGALVSGAQGLRRFGMDQARRALTNGARQLSNDEVLPDAAVRAALDSKAIRFGSTTAGIFDRLKGLTKEEGARYAAIIKQLEDHGVHGPEAETLAERLFQKGVGLEPNTMNSALPNEYLQQAEAVMSKPTGGASRLRLSQTEDLKRSLQEQAKYGKVDETPLNKIRRDIASTFRQGNEEAIDSAAAMPGASQEVKALAGQFKPVKERLGNLIEAREAARKGAARGSQRKAFGLQEAALMGPAMASGDISAVGKVGLGGLLMAAKTRGTSASAISALRSAQMSNALGSGAQRFHLDEFGNFIPAIGELPATIRQQHQNEHQDEEQAALLAALRR
jgi:hypothetical protein